MAKKDVETTIRCSIVITGGGTAGHVFPALAVAQALVDTGYPRSTIRFIGSRRGMEATLVPAAGFAITLLGGRGIIRRPTLQNIPTAIGLFGGFLHALVRLIYKRPRAIVTVGGYASVPTSLAGALLGIAVVVVNVDAVPGLANRMTARFAKACAVAFAGTPLPRSVVTGAPVRDEITGVVRDHAGRKRALDDLDLADVDGRQLLAIVGGSLGARRLNSVGCELAERWAKREDLFIYHVVGERNVQEVEKFVATHELGANYRYVAFEQRMPELLVAADLVLCRSGAMTVAELSVVGTPSVLVPLPGAPNDHQMFNAKALANHGAAVIIVDGELCIDSLTETLGQLLGDTQRLKEMGDAARALGKRDAARAIAALVDNVVTTT